MKRLLFGLIVAAGLILAAGCQCCGGGNFCDMTGCGLFGAAPSDCGPTAPPPAIP